MNQLKISMAVELIFIIIHQNKIIVSELGVALMYTKIIWNTFSPRIGYTVCHSAGVFQEALQDQTQPRH